MQTSGKWSIHCVTEKAKRTEEVEARVIRENIDLERELRATKSQLAGAIDGRQELLAHNSRLEAEVAFAEKYRSDIVQSLGMSAEAHWGDIAIVLAARPRRVKEPATS